jgi:urease accessory protein
MMKAIIPGIVAAGAAIGLSLITASEALAHTPLQQAASFVSGFAHPFAGTDHMLAMLAVGVWSVVAGGRAVWIWPTAFVTTMLAGFAAAILGWQLPGIAAAISASIIVLGLLVALAVKAPVWVGAAVVGLFAFFHGHAHGTEAAAVSLAGYAAGFAIATATLHVAGIGLGLLAQGSQGRLAIRACGAVALFAGIALIGV